MNWKFFNIFAAFVLALVSSPAQEARPATATAVTYPESRLGLLQPASRLLSSDVWNREGHKLGRLKDLIVDWNSGRILCALVTPANLYGPTNYFVAIPARCFELADRAHAVVDVSPTNLLAAPRFSTNGWETTNLAPSLNDSFTYFNQPASWDEKADLAQQFKKLNDLTGAEVDNRAGVDLGKLSDVMVDLPQGQMLFALIAHNGWESNLYAAPPSALLADRREKIFRLDADPANIFTPIERDNFLLTEMADPEWAVANYRAYGRDLLFNKPPAPR